MSWHAIYVKPRHEKKFARLCEILNLIHYLPLRTQTKVYQRRKVILDIPVFKGYVFASFENNVKTDLFMTDSIIRVIKPVDEVSFLFQLDQIKMALMIDPSLNASKALYKGLRVRINTGPFMGIEGIIDSVRKNSKIYLNVEMIGQSIVVMANKEDIEIMGPNDD